MQGDTTTGMLLLEARAALPASPLRTTTGCPASMPAATELAVPPLHQVTPSANLLALRQPPLPPDNQRCVLLPTRHLQPVQS